MSSSYLDEKVRDALKAADGGRAMAQKTLMLWAWQDDRLLKEMARPFLKAIAAAALEGAVRRGVKVPGVTLTVGGRAPAPLPPSALELREKLEQLRALEAANYSRGRAIRHPLRTAAGAGGSPPAWYGCRRRSHRRISGPARCCRCSSPPPRHHRATADCR